jgi:hypothetical protein
MAIGLARMGASRLPAEIELDIGDEYRLNQARREASKKNKLDLAIAAAAEGDAQIAREAAKKEAERKAGKERVMGDYIRDRETISQIPIGVINPQYIAKQEFGPQPEKPTIDLAPIERKARLDLAAISPDYSESFRTGMDTERETVAGRQRLAAGETRAQEAQRLAQEKFAREGKQSEWEQAFKARQQTETERNNKTQNWLTQLGILEKGKGGGGKPIPASAQTAILSNIQNAKKAQKAYALLTGRDVGSAKGSKSPTGKFKGVISKVLSGSVLNDFDPKGIDTRAAIADLGSMVIHDRSGAAVTAAESPRLMPFIPTQFDSPEAAKKKLKRFIQEYNSIVEDQALQYGPEAGYAESPLFREYQQSAPRHIFDSKEEAAAAKAAGILVPGTVILIDGEEVEVE